MKMIQLLALVTLIGLMSCQKADNNTTCIASTLKETIVGNWTIKALEQNLGQVEFKADGTLVDPDEVLIGGSLNGVTLTEKTYSLEGNTRLKVRAAKGSNFITSDLTVNSFTCNDIKVDMIGIPALFLKK